MFEKLFHRQIPSSNEETRELLRNSTLISFAFTLDLTFSILLHNIFLPLAAKTLAIIVGLFIVCWLPFFTFYLISPFCGNCINPTLFSVVFWIGNEQL
jgi:hypothetical protein